MKKALVLGPTGVIGRAIVRRLLSGRDWQVVCASRSGKAEPGAIGISVDLLDARSCRATLGVIEGVTHLFFAAYQPRPSRIEEIAPNLAMLENTLDAVETTNGGGLEKVVLVTGGKFYGLQWGAIKTPARETDPRNLGPNFYYDQEDLLRRRSAAASWSWCNLVPPFVSGYSDSAPMNLVMAIGVFAAISRVHGLPLRFPGPLVAYDSLHQIADADQIASAAAWAATSPNAANQIFNVANGDPSRWRNTWPVLARHFGLTVGDPLSLPLVQVMQGMRSTWAGIAERHGLVQSDIEKLVDWNWADYMFRTAFANDVVFEVGKIRRAGFNDCLDTEERLIWRLKELQGLKLLPE